MKKEENDPSGSGARRQEDEPFRPAEEESFQSGVENVLRSKMGAGCAD
jgi:hypothetical protein